LQDEREELRSHAGPANPHRLAGSPRLTQLSGKHYLAIRPGKARQVTETAKNALAVHNSGDGSNGIDFRETFCLRAGRIPLLDMELLLRLMATVAIVSCARPVLQTRVVLAKTTLLEAWRWGVVALSAWGGIWLVTDLVAVVREGMADQLWLAAAVLMISPFVAALGARRPGSRVWSWFVVLPVMVVLLLPAVTAWNRDLRPTSLRLEIPMLAGYGLVLLMGAGNYLATRFALPSLLVAAACLMVVCPMSDLASRISWSRTVVHSAATILLSLAVWTGARQAKRRIRRGTNAIERVWNDFRDFFGVVWARRLLDRVNDIACQEGWAVRLHFEGLAPADPSKPIDLTPEQSARIESVLRWLLRRFVDPEWIDDRMAGDS
jgi:hypothetical protein